MHEENYDLTASPAAEARQGLDDDPRGVRRMTTKFTAYITKYALTKGIIEMEVEDCFETSPDMVHAIGTKWSMSYFHGSNWHRTSYFHGSNWHRTWDGAVLRAKKMQAAKVKSMTKEFNRIENLTFKTPVKA